MNDYGTLNGHPLGPELPDPVSCERCGHPVWLAKNLVGFVGDQPRDLGYGVWELSLTPPSPEFPWTLEKHVCRQRQPGPGEEDQRGGR